MGDEPFGQLLRRMRELAGLTQEQLAERAGISANAVSSLERGTRRRPYPHTRDALATALGLTTEQREGWDRDVAPRSSRPPLPAPASMLLGRAEEIRDVLGLLPGQRILTLVGPGGVGKTQLALAVADKAGQLYRDGIVFVGLAALGEAADVLPVIAMSLGLRELGPREVQDVLGSYLRRRRMLLVLDNVEHLLDAAPAIAALVNGASGVTVLATSRAALRIRGEHVHVVPVLSAEVAAQLFRQRAEQASGYPLDAAPTVVSELCARMDHLPLAIELAAAQTRLLPAAELLTRLDTVLSAGGPRDAPQRQRTIRDTVRWSYSLLPPAGQALLRQVAVFAGGWTPAAAAALAGQPEHTTLELHLALLDNSLITRATAEPRFDVLETVKAFALEQLDTAGELAGTRTHHAQLFGASAATAYARLWSTEQTTEVDRLEADHENLRSALRHLLALGRIDELADAAFGSWLYWVVRGHLRDLLTFARAGLSTDPPARIRARLGFVAGMALLPRGQYAEAVAHFEDAATAARTANDDLVLGWTLVCWANAEVYRGCAQAAAELLTEAAKVTHQIDMEHVRSCGVIGEAHVAISAGSMSAADQLLTTNVPLIEARQAAWPLAVALGIQGRVASVLGDHDRADKLLTRSVEIFGDLEDTWGMAHQLTHVADVAAQRGDFARAALLYGAVDALSEQVGARVFPVWQHLSDRSQSATLAALDLDTHSHLRRRGHAMTTRDVVELAAGGPLSPDR